MLTRLTMDRAEAAQHSHALPSLVETWHILLPDKGKGLKFHQISTCNVPGCPLKQGSPAAGALDACSPWPCHAGDGEKYL